MGRERGRRHKLRYEVLSVRDKSFEQHLRVLLRERFSVCEAEVPPLLDAGIGYLALVRPLSREPLQIVVPLPAGRQLRRKVDPLKLPSTPVTLSVAAEDDVELWLEHGIMAVQTARIVRLIEEADRAGTTAPASVIGALVALSSRTVVNRLTPLWERLRLPLLGIQRSTRCASSRLAQVLGADVAQRPADSVRRELLLSPTAHRRLLASAARLLMLHGRKDAERLAVELGLSPAEVESTLAVVRLADGSDQHRGRLVELRQTHAELPCAPGAMPAEAARAAFEAHLIRRHAFSPARSEALVEALEHAAQSRCEAQRQDNQVLYWAISDREPAGKCRADCAVLAVRLPHYEATEDLMPRGTVLDLKVRRAQRLATAARAQGALLTLPDLAFLVGMGTSATTCNAASRRKWCPAGAGATGRLVADTRGDCGHRPRRNPPHTDRVALRPRPYRDRDRAANAAHLRVGGQLRPRLSAGHAASGSRPARDAHPLWSCACRGAWWMPTSSFTSSSTSHNTSGSFRLMRRAAMEEEKKARSQ